MKTIGYGAAAVLVLWGAVKMGLLDVVVGGVIGDLAAELNRLSVPFAAMLVAIALPCILVGLGLLIHRSHRALGIELMIVAAVLIFGARMAPVLTGWMSGEATVMSANLSRAASTMPAPAVPATLPTIPTPVPTR
jgi:hypothetical protein